LDTLAVDHTLITIKRDISAGPCQRTLSLTSNDLSRVLHATRWILHSHQSIMSSTTCSAVPLSQMFQYC